MKKMLLALAMAVSASAHAADVHPAPADQDAWASARPDVRVRVNPVRDSDMFLVSAIVTDIQTGRVIAGPSMKVKAGKPAMVQVGTEGANGTNMSFSVVVAPDGESASYRYEFRANGEMIAAQDAVLAVTR